MATYFSKMLNRTISASVHTPPQNKKQHTRPHMTSRRPGGGPKGKSSITRRIIGRKKKTPMKTKKEASELFKSKPNLDDPIKAPAPPTPNQRPPSEAERFEGIFICIQFGVLLSGKPVTFRLWPIWVIRHAATRYCCLSTQCGVRKMTEADREVTSPVAAVSRPHQSLRIMVVPRQPPPRCLQVRAQYFVQKLNKSAQAVHPSYERSIHTA
jgi:hypothetical protein